MFLCGIWGQRSGKLGKPATLAAVLINITSDTQGCPLTWEVGLTAGRRGSAAQVADSMRLCARGWPSRRSTGGRRSGAKGTGGNDEAGGGAGQEELREFLASFRQTELLKISRGSLQWVFCEKRSQDELAGERGRAKGCPFSSGQRSAA